MQYRHVLKIIQTPAMQVGQSPLVLKIHRKSKTKSGTDTLIGRLEVSDGTLSWFPNSGKRWNYRLRWSEFDLLLREHKRQKTERRRKPRKG